MKKEEKEKYATDRLILSMAGKIFAPVALKGSRQNAVDKARQKLERVREELSQPENQSQLDFGARIGDIIAEIAATIYAAQLEISASADVFSSHDDVKNPVDWAIELARETFFGPISIPVNPLSSN